ncbi:hypothetical protein ACSVDE_02855 [Pseudalkalibacillus sp. Hm43]|uniref:hypothetical protein n=1 Tax=Pseudalkalibacillus sp. Hm43 TaxID=3450742 RepID=UPI003F420BA2
MNKKRFVLIVVVSILTALSIRVYNDYRERDLVDLIPYQPKDFLWIHFTEDRSKVGDGFFEWESRDQESADELMDFLSQYRVKRIDEDTYNQFLALEENFETTIYHRQANPAIVHSMENYVHILNGKYYEVVNGPIDIEWIKTYNEKWK